MSRIRLTWDIGSFNPEKHYIYRSDSEISPNNLPAPIAVVGQGVNEYVDDDGIVEGERYYYYLVAEKMGLCVGALESISVLVIQTDIFGDKSTIYFYPLESSSSELIGDYDIIWHGNEQYTEKDTRLSASFDNSSYLVKENVEISDSYTISLWLFVDSIQSSYDGIFNFLPPSGSHDGLVLNASSSSSLRIRDWSSGGNNMFIPIEGGVIGQWVHVIVTWDLSELKVFINGGLEAQRTLSSNINTGDKLYIGRYTFSNGYNLSGNIYNLRVLNRAINEGEALKIYEADI